jgi:Kef-type K+ transport system membrane component KefB
VFIPFFFVFSGMQLDIDALFSSVGSVAKMLLFFVLFFVVRGVPALVLYRRQMDRRQRISLAFFLSTQLPLVLAITTLAQEGGHMRASTAASLVGAAVLSTLCFPILGLRISPRTDDAREVTGASRAAAPEPGGAAAR